MLRGFADSVLLFAVPFLVYAAVLTLRRHAPFLAAHWSGGRLAMLAVAGLGCVALGLLVLALAAPRHAGAYRPAHVEDGRIVPGRIQ